MRAKELLHPNRFERCNKVQKPSGTYSRSYGKGSEQRRRCRAGLSDFAIGVEAIPYPSYCEDVSGVGRVGL